MPEKGEPILVAEGLHKTYRLGRASVPVLRGVSLAVLRGEWLAVLGASGSGKSTLLHLLGGLDRPDRRPRGRVLYEGREPGARRGGLEAYRTRSVGFVFQFYHLLPELSVLENVTVGAMVRRGRLGYRGRARTEAVGRAQELLEAFGLAERLRHRPRELSGGERQRVAIARALINEPAVLLADEPTGNLDRATGGTILDALAGLRERLGLTMVMVTHDHAVAARAGRVVTLEDGVLNPGEGSGAPDTVSPGRVADRRGDPNGTLSAEDRDGTTPDPEQQGAGAPGSEGTQRHP